MMPDDGRPGAGTTVVLSARLLLHHEEEHRLREAVRLPVDWTRNRRGHGRLRFLSTRKVRAGPLPATKR